MIYAILGEREPYTVQGAISALQKSNEINVVAHTGSGRELVQLISQHMPQIVVTAILLAGMSGLDVLDALNGTVPLIFLTSIEDPETIYQAVARGARGYICKTDRTIDLVEAVQRVLDGGFVISNNAAAGLATAIYEHTQGRVVRLTRRETAVLALMHEHSSYHYRRIAEELGLSENTIKTHRTAIYRKLGVNDRASAVREGVRRGLIKLSR